MTSLVEVAPETKIFASKAARHDRLEAARPRDCGKRKRTLDSELQSQKRRAQRHLTRCVCEADARAAVTAARAGLKAHVHQGGFDTDDCTSFLPAVVPVDIGETCCLEQPGCWTFDDRLDGLNLGVFERSRAQVDIEEVLEETFSCCTGNCWLPLVSEDEAHEHFGFDPEVAGGKHLGMQTTDPTGRRRNFRRLYSMTDA